jgi:hypothetical protein
MPAVFDRINKALCASERHKLIFVMSKSRKKHLSGGLYRSPRDGEDALRRQEAIKKVNDLLSAPDLIAINRPVPAAIPPPPAPLPPKLHARVQDCKPAKPAKKQPSRIASVIFIREDAREGLQVLCLQFDWRDGPENRRGFLRVALGDNPSKDPSIDRIAASRHMKIALDLSDDPALLQACSPQVGERSGQERVMYAAFLSPEIRLPNTYKDIEGTKARLHWEPIDPIASRLYTTLLPAFAEVLKFLAGIEQGCLESRLRPVIREVYALIEARRRRSQEPRRL